MAQQIHSVRVRTGLEPRREPYWGTPIEKGRYLGFRKLDAATGTWIARLRDDDGRQRYRSLGQATREFDYTRAKKAAEAWFANVDAEVSDDAPTVAAVCREYVAELKADGRDRAKRDAEGRFKLYVYEDPIGKVRLDKLRASHVKNWRQRIPGSLANQNRNLTALRAALNLAVHNRRVNSARAIEWRSIKPHKHADKRREIFLDLKQRRALIAACNGALRDLVEAAALTGARPGELVKLKRSDFEARTGVIAFTGKTGPRRVPLSPAAVDFFKRVAKGKLPGATLLPRPDGEPWDRWFTEVREAAAKAKLPHGVTLYVLRHSWITEALRSGMSTLDVARLTGTSLQMIEKNYGHLVHDSARERLAGVTML
jgi:integrase